MKSRSKFLTGAATIALVGGLQMAASTAIAGPSLVEITAGAFNAGAGLIAFNTSEYPSGATNPVATPAIYGGAAGSPTVTFGGFFQGQSIGSSNPSACPAGAEVSGCVLGSPTGGTLALDPSSPATFISGDGAQPAAPVLSGSPQFNGPIAILFSTPQSGVGLIGGFFDAACSTGITAFDASGNNLGTVCNSTTGDEFLGLVTSDGLARTLQVFFSTWSAANLPGASDIDNVRFGVGAAVSVPGGPSVPEPASLGLLGAGIAGLQAFLRRRKRA